MSKKHKRYTPAFKAKVALTDLKNEETTTELAQRFGLHLTMISPWKRTHNLNVCNPIITYLGIYACFFSALYHKKLLILLIF